MTTPTSASTEGEAILTLDRIVGSDNWTLGRSAMTNQYTVWIFAEQESMFAVQSGWHPFPSLALIAGAIFALEHESEWS